MTATPNNGPTESADVREARQAIDDYLGRTAAAEDLARWRDSGRIDDKPAEDVARTAWDAVQAATPPPPSPRSGRRRRPPSRRSGRGGTGGQWLWHSACASSAPTWTRRSYLARPWPPLRRGGRLGRRWLGEELEKAHDLVACFGGMAERGTWHACV
ncbi:hypothetical protein [Streptomyces sp. NPDC046332]|uniref:hypothetical protein n=1 Tax=Streptomyces sp. NPDC046332 TaxID=3155133 RepID=UPI0033CD27D5